MNIRELTSGEAKSLAQLNELGISSTLLFLTKTGLEKSILDATEPVRRFLKRNGIHDYEAQAQGIEHKVEHQSLLLETDSLIDVSVSLYRPQTKKGDPRLWPSRLNRFADGGDVIALAIIDSKIAILNLTRVDVVEAIERHTALGEYLQQIQRGINEPSIELLERLRTLASLGPIRSIGTGDTTIGMTIENALGIAPNSNRAPDFRGIEIKAGRAKLSVARETRATLFACVPDWRLSRLKSSAEILEHFGYQRGNDFKLYCTVTAKRENSQGLFLRVDEAAQLLRELSRNTNDPEVAVWDLGRLETQLANKHRETFWIKARSEKRAGEEWFHLESVSHTMNPNLPQLQRMLSDGGVTVDHLIKRIPSGKVSEKGPLFKIERTRIAELFLGLPKVYTLR